MLKYIGNPSNNYTKTNMPLNFFKVSIYKLALTRGGFFTEFLESAAKERVVTNSKIMVKSTDGMSYYGSITSGRDLE